MTAVMSYPALGGPADLHHSQDEATAASWYGATPAEYTDPYIAPYVTQAETPASYPASTADGQSMVPPPAITTDAPSWPSWGRPPPPDFNSWLPQPLHLVPSSLANRPLSALDNRPRSSPSTFGPSAESINWPDNSLALRYTMHDAPVSLTSTYTPTAFAPIMGSDIFASPSPPAIQQPQPRRQYPALAPNPSGFSTKRLRDDDEESGDFNTRRRKRTSSVVSADLNDDDRLLVSLKEDEGLPWKDIAARFGSHHGKTFQVAALQMRYKRLREKFRVWQGEDVEALRLAYEYWEKCKWDIISSKMLDYGIQERWPAKHCARKWQKFVPQHSSSTPQPGPTPVLSHSQFSSPEQGHYAFMPLQ